MTKAYQLLITIQFKKMNKLFLGLQFFMLIILLKMLFHLVSIYLVQENHLVKKNGKFLIRKSFLELTN